MKTKDLIEALESANAVFEHKHGKPMEIFKFTFNEDGYDGDMHIQAVGEVRYEDDLFGCGSKRGLKPHEDIRIHFECSDEKIEDRSITFEDAP